jgi:hypothetical protein
MKVLRHSFNIEHGGRCVSRLLLPVAMLLLVAVF